MNRKFMPIFSQIHAYLFTIFRLPFHQNTPAFLREQDCILYTTEVSWLSVNYCRISKEKKVLAELIFLTLNLLIFSTKIYIFSLLSTKNGQG